MNLHRLTPHFTIRKNIHASIWDNFIMNIMVHNKSTSDESMHRQIRKTGRYYMHILNNLKRYCDINAIINSFKIPLFSIKLIKNKNIKIIL